MNVDTTEIYREKFFQNHKNDIKPVKITKVLYLLEKAVKTQNKSILDYDEIISIGTKSNKLPVDIKAYNNLLKEVYTIWWNNWLIPNTQSNKDERKKNICKSILNKKDIEPNSVKADDIFDIMLCLEDKIDQNAWLFQSIRFCLFDVDGLFADRDKTTQKTCDARLCLNLNTQNILEVAKKLLYEGINQNVPMLFKFALQGGQNDNFIIYVKYKDIERTIRIIDKIKYNNNNLFKNCKVQNPFMAKFKDYIGFGEEPRYHCSFNSARVDALSHAYEVLLEKSKNKPSYLTKKNILTEFKKACEQRMIDPNEFYKNETPNLTFQNLKTLGD